jgi:tetratricopeptide (TPR) repeat protein
MASSSVENRADQWLRKATEAATSSARAKYATRGLARVGADAGLRALLLRQLYLSQMESERFADAEKSARQMLELGVLPDVACQDLARALIGLGRTPEAIVELRRASRVGPASRRAFHLWTLGTTLYLAGDGAGAARALERAVRWGTTARPLYQAQLLLARLQNARRPALRSLAALAQVRQNLEEAPSAQGYGRFVLGELARWQGDAAAARRYLEEFVHRTENGRVALRVGLSAELSRARSLLAQLEIEESAKV